MDRATTVDGFSTRQVNEIAGVPMSTLHYWATTGVVTPSIRPSEGRRVSRWWTLADLVAVRTVKALREAGCPLQTLRRAQQTIVNSWDNAESDAVLVWDGKDLLSVGPAGDVTSAIRYPGQGVLHVVATPIGAWREESRDKAVTVDLGQFATDRQRRMARPATPVVRGVDLG